MNCSQLWTSSPPFTRFAVLLQDDSYILYTQWDWSSSSTVHVLTKWEVTVSRRRRRHRVVVEDRSVAPVWPCWMAARHRSAGGHWWSWRSWSIQRLRGRPELQTQSRSGRLLIYCSFSKKANYQSQCLVSWNVGWHSCHMPKDGFTSSPDALHHRA